jgi:hypothetical protein
MEHIKYWYEPSKSREVLFILQVLKLGLGAKYQTAGLEISKSMCG